jgi:hypothetical protein
MRDTFGASGIPKTYWHEVVKSCCFSLNQLPRKGESISPCKMFHGFNIPPTFLKPLVTTAIVLSMNRVKGRKFHKKG